MEAFDKILYWNHTGKRNKRILPLFQMLTGNQIDFFLLRVHGRNPTAPTVFNNPLQFADAGAHGPAVLLRHV